MQPSGVSFSATCSAKPRPPSLQLGDGSAEVVLQPKSQTRLLLPTSSNRCKSSTWLSATAAPEVVVSSVEHSKSSYCSVGISSSRLAMSNPTVASRSTVTQVEMAEMARTGLVRRHLCRQSLAFSLRRQLVHLPSAQRLCLCFLDSRASAIQRRR